MTPRPLPVRPGWCCGRGRCDGRGRQPCDRGKCGAPRSGSAPNRADEVSALRHREPDAQRLLPSYETARYASVRECPLSGAVQTRSEASCSDSRSAIMIVGMWANPEGTSDIRLMSDYVSTTRRSSYTGTGRLKPFISSCTAGCASTESSKAENARWLRRICPAAAASLSLAARLVTGPSTP